MADTPVPPHAESGASREGDEGNGDDSLQTLSREQRDYAREALTKELGRDPSDEEMDDWLRQQTEGY